MSATTWTMQREQEVLLKKARLLGQAEVAPTDEDLLGKTGENALLTAEANLRSGRPQVYESEGEALLSSDGVKNWEAATEYISMDFAQAQNHLAALAGCLPYQVRRAQLPDVP